VNYGSKGLLRKVQEETRNEQSETDNIKKQKACSDWQVPEVRHKDVQNRQDVV